MQEARGGRGGVGPAGCCQPKSQVHSGLAKLLRSRTEGGRYLVLRLVPSSEVAGMGWKSAVYLQVRTPWRACDLQVVGGLVFLETSRLREERV